MLHLHTVAECFVRKDKSVAEHIGRDHADILRQHVLAVAAARPQLTSDVPVSKTTIILALDESGSMCLTDVLPNRLTVAQHAAREFVDAQPKGAQMGLVLFAGYAELAVPPTTDRRVLDQALNLSLIHI